MPPTKQERNGLYHMLLSLVHTLLGLQSIYLQRGKSLRMPT